MALQTDPYTFTNGTVADALEVNARFDPLYTMQNGALDATNMDLTGAFAWSGIHTFQSGKLQLGDSDASHHYIFTGSDLAADRIVTLPLLASDASFVMTEVDQTINGEKTFTGRTRVTINPGSDPAYTPGVGLAVLNNGGAGSDSGIAINAGTAGVAFIDFGDSASSAIARIILDNTTNEFTFTTHITIQGDLTLVSGAELIMPAQDPPSAANYGNQNSLCKAWLEYADGSGSVATSFNITSVTDDDGDGRYDVNLDLDFSSTAYAPFGGINSPQNDKIVSVDSGTAGVVYVETFDTSLSSASDSDFSVACFGTQ